MRDERHVQISVATDASASGWGASIISPFQQEILDYWSGEELSWDIATKEAMAINNSLLLCRDKVRNVWVDALVDNQAVVHAIKGKKSFTQQCNEETLYHHGGVKSVLAPV